MEVDPPSSTAVSLGSSNLKRSNSAPMINVLAATHVEPSSSVFRLSEVSRLRRFSSSSAALNQQATSAPVKIPDRVNQIKHEESDITHRETAHERSRPGTSKSNLHRKKMQQNNPDKYNEYLSKQKTHMREKRDKFKRELSKKNTSAAAKEKLRERREKGRIRQQRYKEKKKNLENKSKEKLIVKLNKKRTRATVEEQRERWRSSQQKCREKWTHQKREWKRRKDRVYQQRRRDGETETTLTKPGYNHRQTLYNDTNKARQALPNTPRKYAAVLGSLFKRNSPRKKRALKESRLTLSRSLFSSRLKSSIVSSTTKLKKIVASKLLKTASRRLISRQLKMNRKTITTDFQAKRQRKTRVDPGLIRSFFFREDISRPLPQKRYATKFGPGYLLQMTLKSAYKIFHTENPDTKLSFSVFCRNRPKNVRLLSANHRDFCLCVYCINVRSKLLALNRVAALTGNDSLKVENENRLVDVLLCAKSDGARFHGPECINATCPECKFHGETLKAHYADIPKNQIVTWNHWETAIIDGKKKRVQLAKSLPVSSLLDEFVVDVEEPSQGTTFVQHITTANWQYMQFNSIKDNLPSGYVLQVLDFAKNRNIVYQDEIKAAFYGNSAVTIHPIVTYYRREDTSTITRDALIFVSEDNTHDFHAVQHFCHVADSYMEKKLGKTPEMKIIFSDGCSSQYKSKGPFADLSLTQNQQINRNFYGSEHGKGQSDGEIGVLNRALDRAIIGRQAVINNAKDLFEWCQCNLTCDGDFSQRHFFFVKDGDINRDRPFTNVKTVPQTRKIHQATNVIGQPYNMRSRALSCFCKACLFGAPGPCHNYIYTGYFQKKKLTVLAAEPIDPMESDVESVDLVDHILENLPLGYDHQDLPSGYDQHLPSRDDQHLPSRDDQHLLSRDDQHLPSRDDQHLPSRDDQHLPSRDDQHLQYLPRPMEDDHRLIPSSPSFDREIQSTMQISHSWESFSLEPMMTEQRRPRSFSESLHIFTSPSLLCSSPSPTRLVKQCFSPAMQMPVKNSSFTPSPSPSPTRTTFRRCLSPIATRPTHLGKRKFEGDGAESYLSPAKRINSGPNTPDKSGGVLAQPLAHSVSLSSVESGSPDQMVPHGNAMAVDSVHINARKSHCFGFTPVREPSTDMQTTDSETSDIIEMSDGNEVHSDSLVSTSGEQAASRFSHIKQTQV